MLRLVRKKLVYIHFTNNKIFIMLNDYDKNKGRGNIPDIMGSLGSSVVRNVDSRSIVGSQGVLNQLTNRILPVVTSGANLPLSSLVSSSNHSSYFMSNSIQPTQQRNVNDLLRQMPNLSGSASFIGRPYGSGTAGVIGLGGSFGDGAPHPLDLSEFPSLTSRSSDTSQANPSPMIGRQPCVGMVKQPTADASEFTMSNEDFPALPGSQISKGMNFFAGDNFPSLVEKKGISATSDLPPDDVTRVSDKGSHRKGIITTTEGKISNIPLNMVKDQYGMIGLLMFIRAAETDSNLLSLAQGTDLTTLGLNLNSPENLYPNFGGPWAETPCRPQDIDYHVPHEYLTNQPMRLVDPWGKLAQVKFERYGEDLLFYMFYSNVGDRLQVMAAYELYNRDWRYHKEERVWITRAPGMAPAEETANYERGTYLYFDPQNWRKVPKEFLLDYDKLEDRPMLPVQSNHSSITPGTL